jgi:hypothetical protein
MHSSAVVDTNGDDVPFAGQLDDDDRQKRHGHDDKQHRPATGGRGQGQVTPR